MESSFSDDISLLVAVSLLDRCLIVSTALRDPRLIPPVSGGLEGEVTITFTSSSFTSSFSLDGRAGDEPDLIRTGILLNLIFCASRFSSSSSLSSLSSLLSSSSCCSFLRRLRGCNVGPIVSLLPWPVSNVPSSSSSCPVGIADLGGAWKYSDVTAVGMGGE